MKISHCNTLSNWKAEGGSHGNDDRPSQSQGLWPVASHLRSACRNAEGGGPYQSRVYHSADSNKSEIVVVFDTEDTKKAKDFAVSTDLKKAMDEAGVLDAPTIYFLESID